MKYSNKYPLLFYPILEETIWANNRLKEFREVKNNGNYGISWEVSTHKNANNIIKNGEFKNKKLIDIVSDYDEILGSSVKVSDFLRISYIDAKEDLSIQVHPFKKAIRQNELWYILDAFDNAKIVVGFNSEDKDEIIDSIINDKVVNKLNYIKVKKGDVIYIPAGLVHAIGSNISVLEIGENHDNTYRLYDYNRNREIHKEKGLASIDFFVKHKIFNAKDSYNGILYSGEDFIVEMINSNDYKNQTNAKHYVVYTNLGNNTLLHYNNSELSIKKGESVLIPADFKYKFVGSNKLLKSYLNVHD